MTPQQDRPRSRGEVGGARSAAAGTGAQREPDQPPPPASDASVSSSAETSHEDGPLDLLSAASAEDAESRFFCFLSEDPTITGSELTRVAGYYKGCRAGARRPPPDLLGAWDAARGRAARLRRQRSFSLADETRSRRRWRRRRDMWSHDKAARVCILRGPLTLTSCGKNALGLRARRGEDAHGLRARRDKEARGLCARRGASARRNRGGNVDAGHGREADGSR